MMPNEEREWWCTDVHTLIREQEKRATERLIKEQVHTSHADNSAMESKIMNIQFITIDGQRYALTPVGEASSTAETGIASLRAGDKKVSLSAEVLKDWKLNVFTRKNDGSEGRVHSLLVGDGDKSIKVAAWDSHTETLASIQEGDTIVIDNGYVKLGQKKDDVQYIELHVGKFSTMTVFPKEGQATL